MSKKHLLALAFAAIALPSAPAALAQAGSLDVSVEEAVVTARKRAESLQEVPIAITALSADRLDQLGATDLSDLSNFVPSVTLEPTRGTNSTLTAFIRGLGQNEPDPLAGIEQGVGLYIDDVYLPRPQASLLSIYDIDRVEVLRGPQGTLFGRNSAGGAVRYITRSIPDEAEFRVAAAYGNHGQTDLVARFYTAGEAFRFSGAVASLQRDGYGKNLTTNDDNYGKDVTAYRVTMEADFTDDVSARLTLDSTQDDSPPVAGYRPRQEGSADGGRGQPIAGSNPRHTYAGAADAMSTMGINGNNEVTSDGIHVNVDWNINDEWTLKSITATREDNTESVIDFDSLEVQDFDGQLKFDNETVSQEFRAIFTTDGIAALDGLTAVMGLYFLDHSASHDFDGIGMLDSTAMSVQTAYLGGEVDTSLVALYGDVTIDVNERLSVSVGGRQTSDKREVDFFQAQYEGGMGSPAFGTTAMLVADSTMTDYEADETFSNFSGRLAVNYELVDGLNLYASYSQGFKAGGFDPRGLSVNPMNMPPTEVTTAIVEVEEGYDPETVGTFELGLKANWWGGRALTNLALFVSDYQDMQVAGSVLCAAAEQTHCGGMYADGVTNAAQATIVGMEAEGRLLLTDALSLDFAMSRLNATIDEWEYEGMDLMDDIDPHNDRDIQNTPRTMLYLGFTHVKELWGGNLAWNLNWTFRGATQEFELPAAEVDQEAYDLFNASLVWTSGDDHWQVGLYGKNLTDEAVRVSAYCYGKNSGMPPDNFRTDCPPAGGQLQPLGEEDNVTVFYGPPRTLSAKVEYRL